MEPQVVWLFKELKKLKDEKAKSGLTVDQVDNFCKEMDKRKSAGAMMAALFDIAHIETPMGRITRAIDRVAIQYSHQYPSMKKYDEIMNEALDSSFYERPIFQKCKHYKLKYQGNLPNIDTVNFGELLAGIQNLKKARLFDPANLF